MFRNLQIEWMKIKNYRVFQVFSVLYMLGILIIIYIFYKIYTQMMSRVTGGMSDDIFKLFSEDTIWTTVCFSTSFLLYLPGMVIINLFINEVNFKTHRQNIIDGWKRETFIYTKIGLITCISIVVTVMNIIATAIMCNVTSTHFSIIAGLETLGYTFVQTFVYLMFALLLATILRRSGVAIIVYFIYGLLLEFIFMWLFWKIFPGLQHFLPLQVSDSLISFPGMDGIFGNKPDKLIMLGSAIAFAGLYVYLAVRKYKYDDL
jgi:ABC-type transport system involved in multi-copper enzyme maturation permease subunit